MKCLGQARREANDSPENFWAKVRRTEDPTQCWPWKQSCSDRGYGAARFQGEDLGAHVVAYVLTYGPIPDGLQINHRCQTRSCCNPAHLYAGTQMDAMHDRQSRGAYAQGNQHPNTKILQEHHAEILMLRVQLHWKWEQIAQHFGVARNTLLRIAKKHVPAALRGKIYLDKRTGRRAWRKANPDKAEAEKSRRRAREANVLFVEPVVLNVLYVRDKGICQICHLRCKRKDASRDHVIPVSEGGEHSYRNCVLAHKWCNSKKGNRHTIPQQQRLFG
jgi:5-methylcytosine-specific restriction endonuclease McrA